MTRYFTLTNFAAIGCIIFLLLGCTKKSSDVAAPNYTDAMVGTRNWHRQKHYTLSNNYPPYSTLDTFITYTDTTFSLDIVDDSTINYLGSNLTIDAKHSSDSVLLFGLSIYDFVEYGEGSGLIYYVKKDSILHIVQSKHHNDIYWTREYTF